MKQKLIKLIKILEKFTIDDIATISEFEEKHIIEALNELEQLRIISKISETEYCYIKNKKYEIKINHKKNNNGQKFHSVEINKNNQKIYVPQVSPRKNDIEEYNNAPEYAKPYLRKYITILNLVGGLHGKDAKEYLKRLGSEHPDYKMSYTTYRRLAKNYDENGIKGIMPKYGRNRIKSSISPELYEEFKNLYFKERTFSVERCLRILADRHPEALISSGKTFSRLLHKEYSSEAIRKIRTTPRHLPTLRIAEQIESSVKNENCSNKFDLFIDGANSYLEDYKSKQNNKEITYYGYVKNHLIPFFKDYTFDKITQELVYKFQKHKLSQGYSISSISRYIAALSDLTKKYSNIERQFIVTANYLEDLNFNNEILSNTEIEKIIKSNSPELWILALGLKPVEIMALNYEDINIKNRTVIINKIIYKGNIQKYRTNYQVRELRIPNIIFSKLKQKTGKLFNEVNVENYDIFINTHIKLMLDKNVQINIISKNLGFQKLSDFENRYNFLLPQQLDKNFELF